jgi:hypothetical protein
MTANLIIKTGRLSLRIAAAFGALICLAPAAFFVALLVIIAIRLINEPLADALFDSPAAVLFTGYVTLLCGWLVSRKRSRAIDQPIDEKGKFPKLPRRFALPGAESITLASGARLTAPPPTQHPLTAEQVSEVFTKVTGQKPQGLTYIDGLKGAAEGKPDPNDPTKCDLCGKHKPTVRQRKVATIGAVSRTIRSKFCDECVASIGFQRMPQPPPHGDFLIYYDGERENLLVRPQNSRARTYLETLAGRAPQWLDNALVVKESEVISLIARLLASGFRVNGDKTLAQTPRLFTFEGKPGIYTAGRPMPPELVAQILKRTGTPN